MLQTRVQPGGSAEVYNSLYIRVGSKISNRRSHNHSARVIFARIVHLQVPHFSSNVLPTLEQFTGWLSHPTLGHEEV
jgi:hypothetical protein